MGPFTIDFAPASTSHPAESFGAGTTSEKAANIDQWTNGGHQWLSSPCHVGINT
jgi:hypothetical protein